MAEPNAKRSKTDSKGKVCLVGSGIVGRSFAVIFSKAGYSVSLHDTVEQQLKDAMILIKAQLEDFENKGLLKDCIHKTADAAFSMISTTLDLKEAMDGAFFLQESVPENLELKQKIFKEFDALASKDMILSSSTSAIVPSRFTLNLKHTKNCLVSHPINPPALCPFIEILPSPETDQEVVEKTLSLWRECGMSPITVKKEVAGFVLNRLQYALMGEAYRLVENGVCSPEDVNTTLTDGLAMRWSLIGPFETIHLNAPKGVKDYFERYTASMEPIIQEQTEANTVFKQETIDKIHESMCRIAPVESIIERSKLRDSRLSALAVHRINEKAGIAVPTTVGDTMSNERTKVESKGKICIVGSGLVGRSFAVIFSKAGYSVCLYDNVEKQLKEAMILIKANLDDFESKGLLKYTAVKTADDAFSFVTTATDLKEAMSGAFFLQESVPENLELKQKVFKEFDALASDDMILSSSTSCIVPSKFTLNLKHTKNCIVSHPVNPPALCPFLEVVPSTETNQEVVEKTLSLWRECGMSPITVKKEVAGFVLNRLQYALLAESYRLVENDVCTPDDVNITLTDGLAMRWSLIGPFETGHLNAPKGIKDYYERYGPPTEAVLKEQSETVLKFKQETIDKIHESMCRIAPVESIIERSKLRDSRLSALAVHRNNEKAKL